MAPPTLDPARLKVDLETLVGLGPRGPGSEAEERAARWVAIRLEEAGLETRIEPFEASRWPFFLAMNVAPLIAAGSCTIAGSALAVSPALALAVLCGLFAGAISAALWPGRFDALFDLGWRVRSANVVARSPGKRGNGPTVVLMAHHDTKSLALSLGARALALALALAATLALALVCGSALATGSLGLAAHAWPLAGIAAGGFAVLGLDLVADRSPGALDNASGVALVLALAASVRARIGERATLIAVSTGAEELGLCGALRFAQRHADALDRERTLVINLDILGRPGRVRVVGSTARRAAEVNSLREALGARGIGFGRLPVLLGNGMDHQRLEAAGIPAIGLTQGLGKAAFVVHRPGDRPDQVDTVRLATVGDAVLDTIASWVEAQEGAARP